MDQELKQRLIGAAVVTALAAIFIPMLFDDPIDDSGRMVSELTVPPTPVTAAEDTANKLPSGPGQVIATPDTEALSANSQNPAIEPSLQPSENSLQEEPIDEETGQPIDEQQWIEESRAEEESEAIEDIETSARKVQTTKPDLLKSEASKNTELGREPAPQSVAATKLQTTKPVKGPVQQMAKPKTIVNKTETITPKTIQLQTDIAKASSMPAAATVKKPSVPPKVESTKSNTGLSRWYIQAGSFGKKENALSLWENLQKQGLPVTMETQATAKGPLYRLKVGPELDKKRALDIRDRLNKQKIKTIIIAE